MPLKKSAKQSFVPVPFVTVVRKRDGVTAPFDLGRITNAIRKAMLETGEGSIAEAEMVANKVFAELVRTARKHTTFVPTVEGIQDEVETQLMLSDYVKTAKSYILYREKRAKVREEKGSVPAEIKKLFTESSSYLHGPLSDFVYYTSYARWKNAEGRRETWIETVDRYMDFMREHVGKKFSSHEYASLREAILRQDVCPSMRLLWSAGSAARKSNVCAYNCAYIAPTQLRDFGEIMYVSMCGCGIGFSVESETVEQLPWIQRQTGTRRHTHVVEDSKEGWANAFVFALETWFSGEDLDFDYSKVRPNGARLLTMGGRASGPEPLQSLMAFAREKIFARQGRRLRPIDVHDIACKIGEVVVAGGVRRSAMISLSALDDPEMRDAKKGQFYVTEGQRSMANNSAVYVSKPSAEEFLEEWTALVKSKSGERGIFNRAGLEAQLPSRRARLLKRKYGTHLERAGIGLNPCGEIYLQSKQFCNLTSIVVRAGDTEKDLVQKMKWATMIGTYQSSLTHFAYLSKEWKQNCEAERLLGVSITGYYDNALVRTDAMLKKLRALSITTNEVYAKKLSIGASTAISCVKPHGNSSQLLDTASGMHPRYAEYYIRRVRVSANDPIFRMLKDQGVPAYPEVGQSEGTATTFVLEFPMRAPKGAVVKDAVSALDLLGEWKRLKVHFTEHNPSATIYVGPEEWIDVAHFVYENWDIVGGLSFLPRNDHVYKLAPYEEIDKKEYERRMVAMGPLDFSKLVTYEHDDQTSGAKELACVGGVCEIDDVPTIQKEKAL